MRFSFVLALLALWLRPIAADEAIPMSIAELSQKAQLIVRGKVEGKTVSKDAEGRIFTEVKLAVAEVWKGDPKKPLLTVVHGGGVLGEQKVHALGQVNYDVGEEVIGFFVWNQRGEAVTLSMSQGKFNVKRNPAGEAEAANPFHGKNPKAADGGKALTVEEFKSRVKEALK